MEKAENAFNKKEPSRGERLKRKAEFLNALPGHIKAAKKLYDLFEEFEQEIQTIYKKEFKKSDFEGKQKLLEESDLKKRLKKIDEFCDEQVSNNPDRLLQSILLNAIHTNSACGNYHPHWIHPPCARRALLDYIALFSHELNTIGFGK